MSEPVQPSQRAGPNGAAPQDRRLGAHEQIEPTLATVNVREMAAILRRRKWIVLALTALCVGGAAYRVHTQVPVYQAMATIRLVDTRRSLTGGLVNTQNTEPTTQQGVDPLRSQLQVLLSRAVAGIVVDSSHPIGLRVHTRGFPDSLLSDVSIAPDATADSLQFAFAADRLSAREWVGEQADSQIRRFDYGTSGRVGGIGFLIARQPESEEGSLWVISRDDAVSLLLNNLNAQPRVDTDVIDVLYTAESPSVAQRIANNVVNVFQTYNIQTSFQQARSRRTFVEDQLQQNDSLLNIAETRLNELTERRGSSIPVLSPGEEAAITGFEIQRQELKAANLEYRALRERLHQPKLEGRSDALRALVSSPTSTANPVIAGLYAQLVTMQTKLDSMRTGPWSAAPTHPEVQRLAAGIKQTESDLVNAVESTIASLDMRIANLDAIMKVSKPGPLSVPQMEEQRLDQQIASLRKSGDLLREELTQARIESSVEVGQVEIVDAATLPDEPIGMGKLRTIALGLLLGLVLGGTAAIGIDFIDQMNTRLRRRSELETALSVSALAVIPSFSRMMRNGKRRSWLHRRAKNGKHPVSGPDPSLIIISDGKSVSAEGYRVLRTNLLFAQAVAPLKTIAITSAAPGEGKTTTSANLAVTLAEQGMRVLLVDCDLRRPRVHEIFGCERTPGMTQVLLQQNPLADTVRPGPVPGLWILPAGVLPPNPSELLGSARMRALIEKLAANYDIVLLDSPPVLAASDAAVIGTFSDGVLLVLRAGRTDRGEAQTALHQLYSVGARVVGAVLNDPDNKVPGEETTHYGYYADKK